MPKKCLIGLRHSTVQWQRETMIQIYMQFYARRVPSSIYLIFLYIKY